MNRSTEKPGLCLAFLRGLPKYRLQAPERCVDYAVILTFTDAGGGLANVVQLFRIIDAMVGLPRTLESVFGDAVTQIEEENKVAYVTSVERLIIKRERAQARQQGMRQGMRQGMQQGAADMLSAQLTRKFGALPDWARARVSQANETTLSRWAVQILDAQRIEDVFV